MRIVALVTQKGGSGKSTIASSLAVAAAETGERVFIIDMDPQQSLVRWFKTRNEADLPVEAIGAPKLKTALATLADRVKTRVGKLRRRIPLTPDSR